jgi:hypothetical protein
LATIKSINNGKKADHLQGTHESYQPLEYHYGPESAMDYHYKHSKQLVARALTRALNTVKPRKRNPS